MAHDMAHDAVIVGAGIFGCGIAFELSRRGLDVAVVDMNSAAGMGSTSSSGAIIRFTYTTVDGVRMAWEGNRYWEQFAEYLETDPADHEFGTARKITTGMAFLRVDEELHQLYVDRLTTAGVEFEEWGADQVAELHPYVNLALYGGPCLPEDDRFWADPVGSIPGALYTPDAGYISDPQLAAQNLQTAAEKRGATFRFNERVEEILHDGSTVSGVRLKSGETIEAPIVVNVGGPWSSSINEIAGLTGTMAVTTQPMRHEGHLAPAPAGLDVATDGIIVTDIDQGMYIRPAEANHIFVGSTDPDCDGHDWVDDLDSLHREVTEPLWNRQMMRVSKRFDDFGVPHQRKGVAEAYDVSSDWGPIYDRTDIDGFFVAIGTSGNQFKNACVASHLMGELITAVTAGHDHDRDPLVVTGRFTGVPIDMGAFSRNRANNPDSTNSVLG